METRDQRARRSWRTFFVAVVGVGLFSLAACEVILGIDGHDAHLAPSDAGSGATLDGASEASVTAPECVLPQSGDATLRVGNLVADTARVDVCLTRSGGASALDGKPVIASSGPTCPKGLGFKDVSAPFHVASGAYTIALVAAGSACTSKPLATTQVTFAAGDGQGVYVVGDGTKAPAVLARHESAPSQLDSQIRFVNGVYGLAAIDLGFADSATLPSTLQIVMFTDVPFGAFGHAPSGAGQPDDADGYVEVSVLGGQLHIAAAPTGATAAALASAPVLASRESYTAFAIGRLADPNFPQEIYVCDEMHDDGPLTRCANGGATDLTVDVFDTYLWGPFAPYEAPRTQPIIDAIAQLPSDVACIVDTFPEDVERAIIAAAKTRFPYSAYFHDTLQTPTDDPALQDGGLPEAPTVAPCGGVFQDKLDTLVSCVRDHCVSPAGDEDAGVIQNPSPCLTTNCYSESAGLVLGTNLQQLKCWMCALLHFESGASMGYTRSECKTDVNAGFTFDGASDVILLSRYPMGTPEQWVLGSTDWRTSIVRAPLTLPGEKSVDAYCAIVTDPVGGQTNPYTGPYGLGQTNVAGRQAESLLQIQKLVAYVSKKSLGVPAIVAGEFYAGPSGPGTAAYQPESYAILTAAFGLGAPPGVIPGCTFCGNNPLTSPPGTIPSVQSTMTTYPLLANIPITDVRAATIELKGTVIDAGVPDSGAEAGAYLVPLSTYYDYRATIRVRP